MAQVIPGERKSAVLTPSSLACLAHVPTVNLTAGCAHECRYCYARGYLTHPGEGKVTFYTNTLAKLREELRRKRKKPATVYFSPSSDPFQPVPEVLNMAYDVFRFLLESEHWRGLCHQGADSRAAPQPAGRPRPAGPRPDRADYS